MKPEERSNFKKQEEQEDSLEHFKKNLYSRHDYFPNAAQNDPSFHKHELNTPRDWEGGGLPVTGHPLANPDTRMSILKKIFIGAVVFFLVSVGIAFYVFFGGGNVISSNNVEIAVTGPVSVSGGEPLSLDIAVTNQNNADLDTADLVIDYPDGTTEVDNTTVALKRYREAFGTVNKGATATKKVRAILFGQEGDTKNLVISVEYHVKGSNALFSKKKPYNVAISSAPITMTVQSVKELNADQEVEFAVSVVSNASGVLRNLSLAAEYPFGFTFTGADPKPSWSNSYWQLGDLKPGVRRIVKVRGTVAGQDNEDRTFRFSVGTENPTNENVIGTNFLTATQKVTLRKPFIGAALAFDGDTSDTYVVKPGKAVRADLTLTNNISVKITDVRVSVKPTGSIFNPNSVSVTRGFYRSSDNMILWDQTLLPDLAVFDPDDTTTLSFSFGTVPEEATRSVKNPEMQLSVTVIGKRLSDAGLSESVTSTVSKTVRVASSLGLSARVLYFSGPLTNTGPIPPRVNVDTSYTIVWSLTNGSSDLSNVKVSATLPSYMKWLAVSVPASEKVTYNPIGGQILWDVGDLKAGTGFSGSPREASFQVSLVPSSSQVGSTPVLVSDTVAQGDDGFAGLTVQAGTKAPLTTNLSTDINFKQGQGIVAQ